MPFIRVRIELNKGRHGVPLRKLAAVGRESEKFFQMLGSDVGLKFEKGEWIAVNFEEGSLCFDAMNVSETSDEELYQFNHNLRRVAKFDPNKDISLEGISNATMRQYAQIAENLDSDELVGFGIYKDGEAPLEWDYLSKHQSIEIMNCIESRIQYHGALHGTIHSLNKGITTPYFDLRDAASGRLVKCFFKRGLYEKLIDIMKDYDAIVHLSGLFTVSKFEKKIESVYAQKIEKAEQYLEGDIDRLMGCAPDLTYEDDIEGALDFEEKKKE
ncbi:MAG: hypothetical protein A2Z03_07755 [Chloroflexi bacterium RBG_16_56_8]|nr:MAG: hypothetical protein A2Z03_07755 [Chloroflexi bacterium RBG_16_56_8]